ncbi:hypothetical protein GXM_03057 [Nostoc sphaeroides CCNUC1]|uniref:Uncharacterized protein n=1 Tax=Nostoc sphaeroides CCNUC1 TaxID=2653204 RepID=A0A5P8VYV6_9NOSO|nr:hypothetical protein GXM_03057 [Nostoc sphaeroides CCNUC1]
MEVYQHLENAFYTQLGRFQNSVDLDLIAPEFDGKKCPKTL